MWDPRQVISCGYLNVKILRFFSPPTTNTSFLTKGKQLSLFCLFIPGALPQWGGLNAPAKSFTSSLEREDCRKLEFNFPLLANFLCLVCLLSSSIHCCPLIALFPFFHFVLGPFFQVVDAHSPFVHNVRLFIFHSCLLPCLFYFLLPLSSVFFLKM